MGIGRHGCTIWHDVGPDTEGFLGFWDEELKPALSERA